MSFLFGSSSCPHVIGHITGFNNAVGDIPTELGLLTALESIDFNYNIRMGGSIPDTFRSLTNLKVLTGFYNQISGSVPSWIGSFKDLVVFDFSNNQLTGSLPPIMGQLTELKTLAVDDNLLTGEIAFVNALTNLNSIYLEDNSFEGTIDETFLNPHPHLEVVDVSDNNFVGVVPVNLFEKVNLTVIDMHGNNLTALPSSIPLTINNGDRITPSRLEFLALQNNNLASVPPTITNLAVLQHLDLSDNPLVGPMPAEIGDLTKLTYLFLANTETLDPGPIPPSYAGLTSLVDLSLKSSNRNGTIPESIRLWDNMLLLDLDSNYFTGPLPTELVGMENLKLLLLNRNQLTGTIPTELGLLTGLREYGTIGKREAPRLVSWTLSCEPAPFV